ncbi:glutamate decarboxylase [Carnobacterium gallinarum]|uniref:glutamate decarboxylase n=1 Tax=Carnobacterium gallinarum TaxID=2749 RepID=UPI00055956A5|nr:glutamate decarboxylase [Carnobacterium gallinarum]
MLYGKKDQERKKSYVIEPIFGTKAESQDIPKYKLGENPVEPSVAYRLVKDELLDEGNARQNLATFCQTYMEDEATLLMAETLEKNAIDKSEYPRTAELENRCVSMLADLWHAPEAIEYVGTSTVGSSEACMLGGLAMKFRWRNNAEKLGLDLQVQKPNLVISSGYQVCWEKFCVYWDIEMRVVPMSVAHMSIDVTKVMDYVDPYTIGIVGILGITYTGKFDDIAALDALVEEHNRQTDYKVYIHVDGASGAMFVPFIDPELVWDFRLKNVVSINTSGHKYGLVYPGIGWVLWRDKAYLPEELIFEVSYLGGKMPTMAINFSRSASPIIGQYYNFLRFGFEGYRAIHERTKQVAIFLANEIKKTGLFEVYNDGRNLPIVCYRLKESVEVEWTLYELADRLQMKGWQVPAYPLPPDLQTIIIQRYVVRADFGQSMAEEFIEDFNAALKELEQARILFHDKGEHGVQGFIH